MEEVGIQDPSKILFIDDSLVNVQSAKRLGWGFCVWFNESWSLSPTSHNYEHVDAVIKDLKELYNVWPWIFDQTN